MWTNKITAFTLLELLVGLLISGILVTIVFGSLAALLGRHHQVAKEQQLLHEVPMLQQALSGDVLAAKVVVWHEQGFICRGDSQEVIYRFENDIVLRELAGRVTAVDTFRLAWKERDFFYSGKEASATQPLVDRGAFVLAGNGLLYRFGFIKEYDAATMVQLNLRGE